MMMVPTRHESETALSMLVAEIKKQKLQLEGVESVQQVAEEFELMQSKLGSEDLEHLAKRTYGSTSLCGFPFNKVDFGCGKPKAKALALRSADRNGFLLMDTPMVMASKHMLCWKRKIWRYFTMTRSCFHFAKFICNCVNLLLNYLLIIYQSCQVMLLLLLFKCFKEDLNINNTK
ncbi:putative chloramphenicol acetyltransferase-like domain superfamily [Helianthus annuus]|nr:putative chloramphenicol acetyltransferase-like domain superfamily [Helianthus annuus]